LDLDEHLVLLGDGTLDFFKSLNLRRPVRVEDDGLHLHDLGEVRVLVAGELSKDFVAPL
jgi:hypothetical protein